MKKTIYACLFLAIFLIFICCGIVIYHLFIYEDSYEITLNSQGTSSKKLEFNIHGMNPGDQKEYILYIQAKKGTYHLDINCEALKNDTEFLSYVNLTIATNQETKQIEPEFLDKENISLSFHQTGKEKIPIYVCFSLSLDAGNEIMKKQATILLNLNIKKVMK